MNTIEKSVNHPELGVAALDWLLVCCVRYVFKIVLFNLFTNIVGIYCACAVVCLLRFMERPSLIGYFVNLERISYEIKAFDDFHYLP